MLFIKFGSEILKTAIEEKYDDIVGQIIDKIIEINEINQNKMMRINKIQ